jgi:hypothetical protein
MELEEEIAIARVREHTHVKDKLLSFTIEV